MDKRYLVLFAALAANQANGTIHPFTPHDPETTHREVARIAQPRQAPTEVGTASYSVTADLRYR